MYRNLSGSKLGSQWRAARPVWASRDPELPGPDKPSLGTMVCVRLLLTKRLTSFVEDFCIHINIGHV